MTLLKSFAMNGGYGPLSYTQNSIYQRGIIEAAKVIINEEITIKLDIQKLSSGPFRIADLGCSCGPNTILATQNIVEAVERKFKTHGLISPEFHVFFNDQICNDFNSLFGLLPVGRKYYAAGVPGSFYDCLFPMASLHFVFSSCALSILSEVPKRVVDKTGPAWNKGRIHYKGAPKEVFEAYSDQFAKDMESFLKVRVTELTPGGLMALVTLAVPDVASHPKDIIGSEIELMGTCLMEMAKMELVSEAKVDAFNAPLYYTSPKELQQIIEGNGCFSIERMDILNNPKHHTVMPDLRQRMLYVRAVVEKLIEKHFGSEILDHLFEIYERKLSESPLFLNPDIYDQNIALFVLLKKK
ncbi:hypothetical protein PTKIN_Ptkin16aG0011800 [Pterospermum kingtungense]